MAEPERKIIHEVKIISIEKGSWPVEFLPGPNGYPDRMILVNKTPVLGLAFPNGTYPQKVKYIKIFTDKNQNFQIYSTDSVIHTRRLKLYNGERLFYGDKVRKWLIHDEITHKTISASRREHEYFFHYQSHNVVITGPHGFLKKKYTFDELSQMKVDDVLLGIYESPMTRQQDGSISNGNYGFPARIQPGEYGINSFNWPDFLNALEGKYWSDFLKKSTSVNLHQILKNYLHHEPQEYPFHKLENGSVSDGMVLYHPKRIEIRLTKNTFNWELYLEAIIGKYYREIKDRPVEEVILEKFGAYSEKHPLRKMPDGGVSDGYYYFPKVRPYKLEWRKKFERINFATGIRKESWPFFLDLIVGCNIDDINTPQKLRRQIRSKGSSNQTQHQSAEKVPGKCFDGKDSTVKLTLGNGYNVYEVALPGKNFYVVDSPNHGTAVYVFANENDANNWASRTINYKKARSLALFFTPHVGNWEERVAKILK